MKKEIKNIKRDLKNAAKSFVSDVEAEYFARETIDTHLKSFPRTNPLKEGIGDIESWSNKPDAEIEVQVDKPGSLLLNFNELGPSLKIKYIHDELESRAKKNGIAMVGVNNSWGFHTLNLWTDGLAKRGLIGIAFFNGGPGCVVPYGGKEGILGTNPISYAVPTEDKPIIADMATSQIPYFEIRKAKEEGKKLKEGVAVNQDGELTTNADEALTDEGVANILPLGGSYKGYTLVLLVEIITGSLVRSFLSTEMSPEYVNKEHGGLILAIDISSLTDLDEFKKSVTSMCKEIRNQKPGKKVKKITIPGDRSYKRKEEMLKKGMVEIENNLLDKLEELI